MRRRVADKDGDQPPQPLPPIRTVRFVVGQTEPGQPVVLVFCLVLLDLGEERNYSPRLAPSPEV